MKLFTAPTYVAGAIVGAFVLTASPALADVSITERTAATMTAELSPVKARTNQGFSKSLHPTRKSARKHNQFFANHKAETTPSVVATDATSEQSQWLKAELAPVKARTSKGLEKSLDPTRKAARKHNQFFANRKGETSVTVAQDNTATQVTVSENIDNKPVLAG